MPKRGKRYQDAAKNVDRTQNYSLDEAVKIAKDNASAKFDETIEMHFRLGIDPRQAEQQIRTTVMLPNGLGKSVTVLVFAEGEDAKAAEDAGADIIADNEIIAKIQNEGWTEFDMAIAVPSMMPKVGRLGRVLGPRNLMPSPRAVQSCNLMICHAQLKNSKQVVSKFVMTVQAICTSLLAKPALN